MKEQWMDVLGYEGLYQASDLGRVRSLRDNKILRGYLQSSGYIYICLTKDKKEKTCRVHRLVWEAFNGKIPEGLQVNHINEDKTDNRLSNLNLMSPKENVNWGTCIKRRAEKLKNGIRSKPIIQSFPDGQFIREYPSIMEATRYGFNCGNLWLCCNGKQKQHKGFIFRYKECINS